MSLSHHIERIHRIDKMIRHGRTGSPGEFANRIGISVSMLYYILNDLRALGAPIGYCRRRRSYRYTRPGIFKFGYELTEADRLSIGGGSAPGRIVSLNAYQSPRSG